MAEAPILLSCQNLTRAFGARELFTGLSFGVFEGERIGLIGPNGAGKSSLLKLLAGLDSPDGGTLTRRRGLRVAHVPQSQSNAWDPEHTPRMLLNQALESLELEEHARDARVERALQDALFVNPDQAVGTLSGGWRKRLAVMEKAVQQPDLLLLDEPTNHLDLEGVLWLEEHLAKCGLSQLVVTHDRSFLERICTRIIELNRRYPEGFFSCPGNYSQFLERQAALFEAQLNQEAASSNTLRREVEWLRRGPKARSTKQQARIDRAEDLSGDVQDLRQRNREGRPIAIDFNARARETKRLVELIHVHKAMGGRALFGPLDILLSPGDKLGLLGTNGSGKTTFLRILAGELEADAGTVKRADSLEVVRFDQHREQLDLTMSLKEALAGSGEHVHFLGSAIHVAGWAKRFLFKAEQLDMPLSRLSGGEQSRVLIAQLMLKPADLLLLDEPTNDLDLASLEVLEQSLLDFPGALVLVTHDRWLLDRVSQRLLALDGQGQARLFADYAQWSSWQESLADAEKAKTKAKNQESQGFRKKRILSTRELNELKGMEQAIAQAEAALEEKRRLLHDSSVSSDAGALIARQQDIAASETGIERLFARWQELEAKLRQGQEDPASA
jgi:ATP-binding cassette subfamily F protein uup